MSNLREDINTVVDQYVELLPTEGLSNQIGAESKASKFLLAIAKLAALRDQLLNDKIQADSLKSVSYAEAINGAAGTNAPTKTANAEANAEFLEVEGRAKRIDNDLMYVKTMMEVFNNAHILYRGLMKGEI